MRKIKMKVLIMGLIVMLGILFGKTRTFAAELTTMTPERVGQQVTAQADVDGDGVPNTITAYCTAGENVYTKNIYVKVDGKQALKLDVSQEGIYGFNIVLAKSDSNPQCMQIYGQGDNDCINVNRIYKYDSATKTFQEMLNLKEGEGRYSAGITKVTSTGIIVGNSVQPPEIGWTGWNLEYVWQDGKLKLASNEGTITHTVMKTFRTDRKLTFYKTAGGKKVAFTLKKGKKVRAKKVKMTKTKMYVQFQYGKKKGWLRVNREYDEVYKFDKNYNLKQEYFKNVYKCLAG